MEFFREIISFLRTEFIFVTWRDVVEVLFFSWIIYKFLRWLGRDTQKNLILPFYGYAAVTFFAYFVGLSSMSLFLFVAAPIAIVFFITLHAETMQKNYVSMKKISTKLKTNTDWIEEMVQTSLHIASKNKESITIIERTDSIEQFISTKFRLNADITLGSMQLFEGLSENQNTIAFWTNQEGKLISVNPTWRVEIGEEWISNEVKELNKWKQDAILITEKTDAVIFTLSPVNRLFDIFAEGKIIAQVGAPTALSILKKYLVNKDRKGSKNANFDAKSSFQQKLT